jgi:hypothetical protein
MRTRTKNLVAQSVLLISCAGHLGCQACYPYRQVSVLVRDAETKKPIAGAEVQISYLLAESSFAPWNSSGNTGENGKVQLRAAPYGELGVEVETLAAGYLKEDKTLPVAAVKAAEPAHFWESSDRHPLAVVVEMYAEPRPVVELVVPTGYRGQIKVAIQVLDEAADHPGQRSFTYTVSPSGVVDITGPPLLRHVFAPDFRARYADGTPLNRHPDKEGEVGFWWLRSESSYLCFLVGTQSECNEVLHSQQLQGGEIRSHASSGKSEGRGRHGGR